MRVAYTEDQFQAYRNSGLPFSLPPIDCGDFTHDAMFWLVDLLYGGPIDNGWLAGLLRHRLKVIAGVSRYQAEVERDLWFVNGIESELEYRRYGELVPSGD